MTTTKRDNFQSEDINFSLVIPVYNNFESLEILLTQVIEINKIFKNQLEAIFVIDGSPDKSEEYLKQNLPKIKLRSKLVTLSRNFGSFPAILSGIEMSSGRYFAVMSADLQEPPEIIIKFFKVLSKNKSDVVLGVRESREDPLLTKIFANIFWFLYRKFINNDMPKGGVDIFGFNQNFRNYLLNLDENNTSLVGLIFWLGFKRTFIKYKRLKRPYGKSSWSISMKIRYLFDSVYAFSDLPIQIIQIVGLFGISFSLILGTFVMASKILGVIDVPGYTALVLLIMFFGSLNIFALSIISGYIYRSYENTKKRPRYVILNMRKY